MKKFIIFLFFISLCGYSQESTTFAERKLGKELCESKYLKSFSQEKEAYDALNKILSTIGAKRRFVVQSCENISNAAAITIKGINYIYYNKKFIEKINSNNNYWINMTILAHEVGHHINQHTNDAILIINNIIDKSSLLESRKMELDADYFAGFVLAKLGAKLNDATEVYNQESNEDDTYSTHPSKSKRIDAITKGYYAGKAELEGEITNTYRKTIST